MRVEDEDCCRCWIGSCRRCQCAQWGRPCTNCQSVACENDGLNSSKPGIYKRRVNRKLSHRKDEDDWSTIRITRETRSVPVPALYSCDNYVQSSRIEIDKTRVRKKTGFMPYSLTPSPPPPAPAPPHPPPPPQAPAAVMTSAVNADVYRLVPTPTTYKYPAPPRPPNPLSLQNQARVRKKIELIASRRPRPLSRPPSPAPVPSPSPPPPQPQPTAPTMMTSGTNVDVCHLPPSPTPYSPSLLSQNQEKRPKSPDSAGDILCFLFVIFILVLVGKVIAYTY